MADDFGFEPTKKSAAPAPPPPKDDGFGFEKSLKPEIFPAGEGNSSDTGSVMDKNFTAAGFFRKHIAPYVRSAATMAGSAIGGTAGSIEPGAGTAIGAFEGGAAANIATQKLQNAAPHWFGGTPSGQTDSEIVKQGLTEAGGQELAGAAGGKVINLVKNGVTPATAKVLTKLFPSSRTPEDIAALGSLPADFPTPTVGQITNNKAANLVEALTAQGKKAAKINAQRQFGIDVADKYAGEDVKSLIDEATRQATKTAKASKLNADSLHDDLVSKAESVPAKYYEPPTTVQGSVINPSTGAPSSTLVPGKAIKAPITLGNSVNYASLAEKQLESQLPNSKMATGPVKEILDNLQQVTGAQNGYSQAGQDLGKKILPYSRVKALKDSLDNFLSSPEALASAKGGQSNQVLDSLRALNNSLSTDIGGSMRNMGADTLNAYKLSKDAAATRATLVNPKMAQDLLNQGISPEVTYSAVARDALSDPTKTTQFLNLTGDRQGLAKVALQKIADNSIDTASRTFDAAKALNELETGRAIYSQAIPSQALSNYKTLLRQLSISQANTGAQFLQRNSLAVRGTQLGLALTTAALTGGFHHVGTLGGELVSLVGLEKGIGSIMMNPKIARAMIELAKMPASSPAQSTLTQVVLMGLKGTTGLALQNNEGQTVPVEIDEKGKVKPQ